MPSALAESGEQLFGVEPRSVQEPCDVMELRSLPGGSIGGWIVVRDARAVPARLIGSVTVTIGQRVILVMSQSSRM